MLMTGPPHLPGDIEVTRNNESHWSGLNVNEGLLVKVDNIALRGIHNTVYYMYNNISINSSS